ncbi:MAG: DPP IV N-terminal domain-containing protein [Cyclobacteriaceae bacterium]
MERKVELLLAACFVLLITASAQTADTDSLVRITMIQNSYAVPTPDGKSLVFHSNRSGNNDIYLQDIQTGRAVQLTSHPENDRTPSVSPDGKKIAFVSTRDGNYDVFVMSIDGKHQVNLTRDKDSKDIHPYWSPDGHSIIFNSTNKGDDYDIYTMRADGKDRQKVRIEVGEATHAQFSPDGKKIAFRKFFKAADNSISSDIVIMDVNTKYELRVTTKDTNVHPVWSVDGRYLIFTSNRDGAAEYDVSLYRYDIASKQITRVTHHSAEFEDMTPAFSPDGKQIYFSRWGFDGTIDLFAIDSDLE